ncbi:hypothetical protein TPA0905_26060 [Streptomyces olivaceus]|nr:hypothetical protein TPA0905_26060 [Streptomyces olivaceus]
MDDRQFAPVHRPHVHPPSHPAPVATSMRKGSDNGAAVRGHRGGRRPADPQRAPGTSSVTPFNGEDGSLP